jgi:hypothetical protein
MAEDWADWKLAHPDGRQNIAYTGAWLADEALARSGQRTQPAVPTGLSVVIAMGLRDLDDRNRLRKAIRRRSLRAGSALGPDVGEAAVAAEAR